MFKLSSVGILVTACSFLACTNSATKKHEEIKYFKAGSFGSDLEFLQRFDSVIVLKTNENKARVIVSPKYQGKVFTSTAEGMEGKSFGWINYKVFSAAPDPHMNAYGGENRLWLGPEGGPYSLFFTQGAEMTFQNWKTPSPFDTEAWDVVKKDSLYVELQKAMQLYNFKGTRFQLTIDRTITILNANQIAALIKTEIDDSTLLVGYRTDNRLTNSGETTWNDLTGMPCIWILDMFTPSASTTIVIPLDTLNRQLSKAVNTNYFGEIPLDRIKIENEKVFFKADGKNRGKLGISPSHALNVAGSYDAESNILTIAFFDLIQNGKYLNQEWTTTRPIFSGDAVNAYNDGPLKDGSQMGPFYEIESVSPAAFLQPGKSLSHQHTVLHFTGSKSGLDKIARHVFGISLHEIRDAFTKK